MEKEYYIYRIQYENLIGDLDRFSNTITQKSITKDEIKDKLKYILTSSYNRTKIFIDKIEEEK